MDRHSLDDGTPQEALALERVELSDDSDGEFKYDAVSVSESDASDGEAEEDLDAALLSLQRKDEAQTTSVPHTGATNHQEAPRASLEVRPSVVDDYIRNFLIKVGMLQTLDAFNTEWYELKSQFVVIMQNMAGGILN